MFDIQSVPDWPSLTEADMARGYDTGLRGRRTDCCTVSFWGCRCPTPDSSHYWLMWGDCRLGSGTACWMRHSVWQSWSVCHHGCFVQLVLGTITLNVLAANLWMYILVEWMFGFWIILLPSFFYSRYSLSLFRIINYTYLTLFSIEFGTLFVYWTVTEITYD